MTSTEKTLTLLKYLHDRMPQPVDSYDQELREILGIGQRQLARELKSLHQSFDRIVEIRTGRRIAYKLVEPIDILKEAYANDLNLGMLFEMAREAMPQIVEEWDRIGKRANKPYSFFSMPYEEIEKLENNPDFQSLKNAVERHEYRDIYLLGGKAFQAVKPIRLLFSEGNWYVAYVDGEKLRISRISFIEKVRYTRGMAGYRPSSISPYLQWLENQYQNPFSRYGVTPKTAVLKAAPNIAHYFDERMKRFFKSQRFVRKEQDGSVVFSVEYTQPMEILPFVKRWLPDMTIIAPQELQEICQKTLERALSGIQASLK